MRKHAKHTQQRIDIKIHVLLGSLKNMKKTLNQLVPEILQKLRMDTPDRPDHNFHDWLRPFQQLGRLQAFRVDKVLA